MGKTDHGLCSPVISIAPSRTMKAIHGRGSFFQVNSGLIWTINIRSLEIARNVCRFYGTSLACQKR